MMQKIVEMYKLLSSDAQISNHDDSIYKVTASLRRLRGDWMLGQWIEGITQASLAFNLWRQKSLTHRASGESFRSRYLRAFSVRCIIGSICCSRMILFLQWWTEICTSQPQFSALRRTRLLYRISV
jgi:hypothetical protein